tara:strand:- start:74 stop:382 length:309 start_codon:yes stop_codon:yes gene_type:complete
MRLIKPDHEKIQTLLSEIENLKTMHKACHDHLEKLQSKANMGRQTVTASFSQDGVDLSLDATISLPTIRSAITAQASNYLAKIQVAERKLSDYMVAQVKEAL